MTLDAGTSSAFPSALANSSSRAVLLLVEVGEGVAELVAVHAQLVGQPVQPEAAGRAGGPSGARDAVAAAGSACGRVAIAGLAADRVAVDARATPPASTAAVVLPLDVIELPRMSGAISRDQRGERL